jgi:hypothetical protein
MSTVPPPLRPEAGSTRPRSWPAQHPAGLTALVLGALAFMVVSLQQRPLWATPDWRLTVPAFVATLTAAIVAFARKEGTPALALLGVGLAAATLVLGWFLVTAAIVLVTAVLILILSAVM